jgi:hypothetical protein
VDSSVKMDSELTWRRKPKPLTYCGIPVSVDATLPPNTAKLIHPETGEVLAEMKIES